MSPGWYRHQAVLAALAINERLMERDGQPDPVWTISLFKDLLGLSVDGGEEQELAIDPLAFSRPVRMRLQSLANATGISGWKSARFRSGTGSAAARTAKLVSTLLHSRAAPPRSLWRIACEALSSSQFPPAEKVVHALDALSRALSGAGKREHKLRAITTFGTRVPEIAEIWPALEPALVQPLLDWVPAVFGDPGDESRRPGLMVPLMVDVARGTKSDRPEDLVKVAGSLQDTTDLTTSAAFARNAACRLWRARFSNAPAFRLAQVATAQVGLDLQLIEGIADALCSAGADRSVEIGGRLYLSGRSLELPIAIAIYDRLVGSRLSGETRASGVLVKFIPDKQDMESGDTMLGFVQGETAKALAAEDQLADRFILPAGSEAPAAQVPAVFARRLGAAVDFAFGPGGDGHRFVRAADVAASFKLKRYSDSAVVKVRDELKMSGSLFQFSGPLSLMVQALFQISASLGPRAFRSRGRYAFVRLSPTERADAAWATIWSALDGDPADLDAFIRAPGDARRARLFARQMTRNKPTFEDPRWSPHVLVVAGLARSGEARGVAQGPYARFDIPRIMEAAGAILKSETSPCDPRLRLRLGQTRIILVDDEGLARPDGPDPELEPNLRDAFEKLSAFRYGFSFDMARRQLGSPSTPLSADLCGDILERLEEVPYDNQPLLIRGATNRGRRDAAPTAFEFMLRRRRLPKDLARREEIHKRAAQAILPILRPGRRDAHVNLAIGLSAPWIDEAYAQLSAARSIAILRGDERAKSILGTDRLRLLRNSGTLILERLPAMMGRTGSRPTYDDYVERLRRTDHPSMRARAVAFAIKLAQNQDSEAVRRELFAAALGHIAEGAKACEAMKDERERRSAMFLIATERCRLAHEGRNEPDSILPSFYRNMQAFVPLALDNLDYMLELYWGDWFWHAGGTIADDLAARRVYEAGLWNRLIPGGGNVGDATLVGWAGTIAPREIIDREMLDRVRAHLGSGFWQRMTLDRIADLGRSPIILHRLRNGLARLRSIQRVTEMTKRRLSGSADLDPRRNKPEVREGRPLVT